MVWKPIGAIGDASEEHVLEGFTFSSEEAGVDVSGQMSNVGQQNITPGTSDQSITEGFHDGTGIVEGDADLDGDNIRSGTSIFGVSGTLTASPSDHDPHRDIYDWQGLNHTYGSLQVSGEYITAYGFVVDDDGTRATVGGCTLVVDGNRLQGDSPDTVGRTEEELLSVGGGETTIEMYVNDEFGSGNPLSVFLIAHGFNVEAE